MAEAEQNTTSNFLIKLIKLEKNHTQALFFKTRWCNCCLNNQFYTFGEKNFVEELKDLKNLMNVHLLLRNVIFYWYNYRK